MTLFPGSITSPGSIEFEVVGADAGYATGSIEIEPDMYFLRPSRQFSLATGQSGARLLKTSIDGVPSVVRGTVFVRGGVVGLRFDEVWVGTNDPTTLFTAVEADIEGLDSICTHRHEDGAARSATKPLILPAVMQSPIMSLLLGNDGVARIGASEPLELTRFGEHLSALRDLVCFATDQPVELRSLIGVSKSGDRVVIHGHNRFPPFGAGRRPPVECLLRLGAAYAQNVLTRWWEARSNFRPVTQVLAGLRYDAGWLEMNVNLLAASVERYGQARFPTTTLRRISVDDFAPLQAALSNVRGLNASQRSFVEFIRSSAGGRPQKLDESLDAIIADLGRTLREAGVSPDEWKQALIGVRNGVSHGDGSGEFTDPELRATRDATRVALYLSLLKFLGVTDGAIDRSADRLRVRYGVRHRGTGIYEL